MSVQGGIKCANRLKKAQEEIVELRWKIATNKHSRPKNEGRRVRGMVLNKNIVAVNA